MNIVKRIRLPVAIIMVAAVLALGSAVVWQSPAQANSEDERSLPNYITVVVTRDTSDPDNMVTNFTITWFDAEDCSTEFSVFQSTPKGTVLMGSRFGYWG